MSDEVTCGCGAWEARETIKGAGYAHWWHERSMDGRGLAYCHECHTELSFDASGQPVARRMVPEEEAVPRAALEDVLRHHCVWDDVKRVGDGDFALGLKRIIDQQIAETRETDRACAALVAQEEAGDE